MIMIAEAYGMLGKCRHGSPAGYAVWSDGTRFKPYVPDDVELLMQGQWPNYGEVVIQR